MHPTVAIQLYISLLNLKMLSGHLPVLLELRGESEETIFRINNNNKILHKREDGWDAE